MEDLLDNDGLGIDLSFINYLKENNRYNRYTLLTVILLITNLLMIFWLYFLGLYSTTFIVSGIVCLNLSREIYLYLKWRWVKLDKSDIS